MIVRKVSIIAMLGVFVLSSCSVVSLNRPTADPFVVETRVAQVLTILPTASPVPPADVTPITSAAPTEIPPTSIPEPTAKPTIPPTVEPTAVREYPADNLGEPTFTDTMDDPNQWTTGYTPFTEIAYSGGMLDLTGSTIMDGWRLSQQQAKNFFAEIDIEPQNCTGADRYGLYFRVPNAETTDQGYLYGLTCSGYYSLRRWDGLFYEMTTLIPWTEAAQINAGPNKVNKLGVQAIDDTITLFVNGQKLVEAKDITIEKGYIGLFVGAQRTPLFTIRADNFRVWQLP